MQDAETDWSKGAAYINGVYFPIAEAKIPVTDWGYRRSDATYDVVGVYFGAFFRLNDHIARFRASMDKLRMKPKETDEEIKDILTALVRRSGLRQAYVAMDCLRGSPGIGLPRHPAFAQAYLACFAIPWVRLFPEDAQERGIHAIVSSVPRIPDASVDPMVKNFHWADMTKASFEAYDAGVDTAILLDRDGYLTEGPGFNVFVVIDGAVVTPQWGALEGITRRSVMELCEELGIPHEMRAVSRKTLEEADEIILTSTAGGVMAVSRLGNRILGNDRPGPMATRLRDSFWAKRRDGWLSTPIDYTPTS